MSRNDTVEKSEQIPENKTRQYNQRNIKFTFELQRASVDNAKRISKIRWIDTDWIQTE